MHALRWFVQQSMAARGWTQSDLARESGITKQVVSGLLTDSRDKLDRLPQDKTVDGLAAAFGVDRSVVLHAIGAAMGLPVSAQVVVYDASKVSDEDLLRALADRLAGAGGPQVDGASTGATLAGDRADFAWAARPGWPAAEPDLVLGEESQDDGGDEPA